MLLFESSIYAFGFYAALNALILLVLSMRVVQTRARTGVPFGDGGNPAMAAPLRAHANSAEYVPTALILLWALASPLGRSIWVIHGMGATFTIGRILHAIGLSGSTGPSPLRFAGMVLTWIAYVIGIAAVVWFVFVPQPTAAFAP
ncbi:MAG TPA: MAPEG family protein [Rhizomicrobium sp.]|nr:MAPEG family protein [Rhizomicrobium sp.]